jgi:hypothetical protein
MRNEKPNIGPVGTVPTLSIRNYSWHIIADVQVTAYVPETLYVVGIYRTHQGAWMNGITLADFFDLSICFAAKSGTWWCVFNFGFEQFITEFDTGILVTQRHTLEILTLGVGGVLVFKIDGVVIQTGLSLTVSAAYEAGPSTTSSAYAGAAVRDNNTPQTTISSLTIYDMTCRRVGVTNAIYTRGDVAGPVSATVVGKLLGTSIETGVPSESDFLVYAGSVWNHRPAGDFLDLDGLGDVVITSPIERQNLQYNGTNWVNRKDSFYSTIYTDRALSSINTVQNVFPSTSDTIALDANSVWMFEGSYVIAAGSITHTTAIGFSEFGNGSCHFDTLTAGITAYGGVQRAQDMSIFNTSLGGPINNTTTSAYVLVRFSGRITVVDATIFVPTLTFSVSPSGTNAVKSGSWIKLTRLWTGASTAADSGWT